MTKVDIHQFRWVEMVNDSEGRTSPTKFIGVLSCLVSLFTFALAGISVLVVLWFTSKSSIDYSAILGAFQNLMMQSVALFTLGGAMLGINRLTKDRSTKLDENDNQLD